MVSRENQLIIFDWSGTLSDDRRPVHQACVGMGLHYNVEPHHKFEDWVANTSASPQSYLKSIGGEADDAEVYEVYEKYFKDATARGMVPVMYPDVPMVLETLKNAGKKLAIISSHPQEFVQREAYEYRVKDYFDEIIGQVPTKSDAIVDLYKRSGMLSNEAIYIGDTTSDVRAARTAIVGVAAVTYGYHTRDKLLMENPDVIWDDIRPASLL